LAAASCALCELASPVADVLHQGEPNLPLPSGEKPRDAREQPLARRVRLLVKLGLNFVCAFVAEDVTREIESVRREEITLASKRELRELPARILSPCFKECGLTPSFGAITRSAFRDGRRAPASIREI